MKKSSITKPIKITINLMKDVKRQQQRYKELLEAFENIPRSHIYAKRITQPLLMEEK